jgi:hypothetical protein
LRGELGGRLAELLLMGIDSVSFELASDEQFERLATFVRALARAKSEDDFRDDVYWEQFLDDRSRRAFWWPRPAEVRDWGQRWFSTPVDRRPTDPSLQRPWTFGSLIEAAENGEFEHLVCRRREGGGVIEFHPYAWPFGGTAWMHALIEAFGGRVTADTAG